MSTEATDCPRVHFTGQLGDSLDRAVRRLRSHPYSPLFIRSDVSFEMPRIFNAYSGDISGRYIEFFSLYGQMGYATKDLAELVQQVLAFQHPEGYFGEAGFDKAKLTEKETKIFWGNGRLLIGLLEYYRLSKNPTVFAAARRLADFLFDCGLHESTSSIGQAVAADAGPAGFATTFCSCIEGVVRLFEETRDERYARLAQGIAALLPETFDAFHSHGRMTALRGMVDLALATSDDAMLNRVARQWQTIHDEHVVVLGGIREHFGHACKRDEGCSVADWVMLSFKLFAETAKPEYLDAAERGLFNHLLANQFQNGGFGHVPFTVDAVEGHADAIVSGIEVAGRKEAYWCCSLHGPRAILEAARHLVTQRSSDSADLNFAASADVRLGDLHLSIATDPLARSCNIAVNAAPASDFTLRVHLPAWAHHPTATLAGTSGPGFPIEGGPLTLMRRWQTGDIVTIELHPQFEFLSGVDSAQRKYAQDKDAVTFGRLLLGYYGADDLLWGQMMRSATTVATLVLPEDRPQVLPPNFPHKAIVEYFDKAQNRTIWSVRLLVPLMLRTTDQPLRTVHTIARRPWSSLTPAQQSELADFPGAAR